MNAATIKSASQSASNVAAVVSSTTPTTVSETIFKLPECLFSVTYDYKPKSGAPRAYIKNEEDPNAGAILLFSNDLKALEAVLKPDTAYEASDVIDGSLSKLYFNYNNGSNYQHKSTKLAESILAKSNTCAASMQFGAKNESLTREEARTAKNLNNGNLGTAAVIAEKNGMKGLASSIGGAIGKWLQ